MSSVADRRNRILEGIESAAKVARREAGDVQLVAVSKTRSADEIEAISMSERSNRWGRGPIVPTRPLITCSKNWLSSRNPITRNVPIRKISTSRLAACVNRSTLSRLHAISSAIPPNANASRNSPNSSVP